MLKYYFLLLLNMALAVNSYPSYTLNLTKAQYSIIFQPYIIEYQRKKCHVLPGTPPDTCHRYCATFYQYVPSLPFKNAQTFNPRTANCEPKPFCPPLYGISYDPATKTCVNQFTGTEALPVDAPEPSPDTQLMPVTFFCKHGRVVTYLGRPDCRCHVGYTSYLEKSWSGKEAAVMKCQSDVPFLYYLPFFLQIYYDPAYDNQFPHPADPSFWTKTLIHYLKQAKYALTTFLVPWQVEIVTIVIPQEDTIRKTDLLYLYWALLGFLFVALLSCYQKCLYGIPYM